MSTQPSVIIVGAGLAGCLLARLLGQAGFKVLVCERRDDPREERYAAGRSINLAISARGIDAITRAGLEKQLLEYAIPMPGRMIHSTSGSATFQPYSSDASHAINSVSRSDLNLLLLEGADECESVQLRFGWRCASVDSAKGEAQFTDDAGTTHVEKADLIVGADGANSAVRATLQSTPYFNYSQSFLQHGYKELSIPPVQTGPHAPFALEPNALHIWPHGASMMIALPNHDGSFTCTLFWPYEGEHSFQAVDTSGIRTFFEKFYPSAVAFMPELEQEYEENPIGPLGTIRCAPWHREKVTLIGDAAHAIVPFYGQGANASFEDAQDLANRLVASPQDLPAAAEESYRNRVEHANAIADMALANFLEMRDHTGRRSFRTKKALERILHRTFKTRFLPLYEMVSFTTIPYADARRKAQKQWQTVGAAFSVSLALIILLLVFIVV